MAESQLSVQYADLVGEVGFFLGFGRGPAFGDPAFTVQQQQALDSCIKSGLSQFYRPAPLPGEHAGYDWSFLRPTGTIALAAGSATIPLPDDYAGKNGPVTILSSANTSAQPWLIEERNEGLIREMYSRQPTMSGPPMYLCERPLKGTSATQGQRFEMFVFPLADQNYQLQVAYVVNPDYFTGAFPYPLGGSQHAETIKASCIAAVELYLDDVRGPRWAYYQERLAASVSADRKNKSQKLGVNRDRSDDLNGRYSSHLWAAAATYNGGTLG